MPASLPPRFTSMDSERHQPTIRRTHADRRAPVAQCSRLGESEEFRSWARLSFTCRTLCHIVLRPPHRRRAKNGTPRTKHTVDRGADGTAGAVVPRRPSDRIRGKYHTLSPVCPTPSNFPRLPLRFNFGSNSRREDGFCYSLLAIHCGREYLRLLALSFLCSADGEYSRVRPFTRIISFRFRRTGVSLLAMMS